MRGLFLKDFLLLRQQLKTLMLFLIVFLFLTFQDINMVTVFIPFISCFLIMSVFSYDEHNKWDAYAISLPVNKDNIIKARYFVMITLLIIGIIISLCITIVASFFSTELDLHHAIPFVFGTVLGISLVLSILPPLFYKFGLERGRLLMVILCVGLPLAISFLTTFLKFNVDLPVDLSFIDKYYYIATPIIVLIFMLMSYNISKRIYMKKSF